MVVPNLRPGTLYDVHFVTGANNRKSVLSAVRSIAGVATHAEAPLIHTAAAHTAVRPKKEVRNKGCCATYTREACLLGTGEVCFLAHTKAFD